MADLYSNNYADLAVAQEALGVTHRAQRVPASKLFGARLLSNDAAGLLDWENWIGKQAGFVTAFAESGNASGTWADSLAATRSEIAALQPLNRLIFWAFPLCHGTAGQGVVETIRGDFDATITTMFTEMAAARPADSIIPVRIGWEFNFWGSYPWCRSLITPLQYITCFRRIVDLARKADARFMIMWCPNTRVVGRDRKVVDPTAYWPGRPFVDIVACDGYLRYNTDTGNSLTPKQALDLMWYGDWGIMALYEWAERQGLPFAIAETGIEGDGTGNNGTTGDQYAAHTQRTTELVRTKNVYMIGLWNKTVFNTRVTNSQYPKVSAGWLAGFKGVSQAWTPTVHFGVDHFEQRDAMVTASITQASNIVSSWQDTIGLKNATATSTAQPTYSATARNSKPGVTFDGVANFLKQVDVTNVPAMGKAVTHFMQVFVASGAANFTYMLADCDATGGSTNTRALGHNGGNLYVRGAGSYANGTIRNIDAGIVFSLRDAYATTDSSATHQASINGGVPWSDENQILLNTFTLTKRMIGANGSGSDGQTGFIAMTLQELGSIAREITKEEHQLLQGYLAWKWGTVANLPATHPYKSAAPLYGLPF